MNGWVVLKVFLIAAGTLVLSFVGTFWLYLVWLEWRYPGNNAQGDMGAFFLAMIVAPICAIIAGTLGLMWLSKSKADSNGA